MSGLKYLGLCAVVITLTLLRCDSSKKVRSDAIAADYPDLVVVISVDQMRYDFFERFEDHFTGGLKRLWDEGTVYSNAHHAHVPTNTAPGHATLSTGCYPMNHGIVSNSFYNRETGEEMYCVVDTNATIIGVDNDGTLPGRSPANLRTTTIGDWLKAARPRSKVYSVARKDRSAVLMGGKHADRAFWYDNFSSKFVSSDYYRGSYPSWADAFVGTEVMLDFLSEGWNKKMPESVYAELRPDKFEPESGAFAPDFPHNKERMRPGYPEATKNTIMLVYTPMADDYALDFAQAIIEEERLGTGSETDLLMIGCSAADAIGHHFGPESHEVMDYYLYLDGYLADLFEALDHSIGRDNYWVALTGDHGVVPLPEALQMQGVKSERVLSSRVVEDFGGLVSEVQRAFELDNPLVAHMSGGIYIDFEESDQKGIARNDLRIAVAEKIKTLDYVAGTYTSEQVMSRKDLPFIDFYRHSYLPEYGPDVLVRLKENYLRHGATGTSHGSPYAYDTHVPIVFWGKPFHRGRYDRRVETVDLAPTLGALLGVKPLNIVDGKVLEELFPVQ